MNIITSDDCIGIQPDHALSKHYSVYGYEDGAFSLIPHKFCRKWPDKEAGLGSLHLGRCSGFGPGSIAKYDGYARLIVGKYVLGGSGLRFLLTSWHEMRAISMTNFHMFEHGLRSALAPQRGDTVLHNDIWIGDEAMLLSGSIIESGCVIGARAVTPVNFRSEPYGIYVGAPARLVRFRFPEKVREKLLELAWWEMPLSWIKESNSAFLADLTTDEGRSLEILTELQRVKNQFMGMNKDARRE